MRKPEGFDYDNDADYQFATARYWQYKYDCAKIVGDACLERLVETGDVCYDEDGLPCWVGSGEVVGN